MVSRKGQAEFVAVAVIIVIALVVVILVLQQTAVTPPEDTGIFEEAKTVKDAVNTLIRTGLKEQMFLVYGQGGMLDPPEGEYSSVEFGPFRTAVWQACDQVSIPDVAKEIEDGIGDYLRKNLKTEEEFAKKTTTFDFSKIDIGVDVFKDELRATVNLPTTIEDYSIPQPYIVSIPTKLYDVLEFSENFVNDNSQGRIFEGALVRCLNKFPTDPESEDWFDPHGYLTRCGERVFKTKSDLITPLKKAIGFSVNQIVWNEQTIRSVDKNCFTPINVVGGKMYPYLNVYFEYPREYWDPKLSQNFFFSPNPVNFVSVPMMPFIPVCMTPYYIDYSVAYPAVVQVEDSLTNQMFTFAVMTHVAGNFPGNCSFIEIGAEEADYIEICVSGANKPIRLTVVDTEGNPIEGADVTFDICEVGRTDVNGVVEGYVPGGLAELHVYKSGYKSYGSPPIHADDIEDMTIVLMSIQENVNIRFNGVPMRCENPIGDVELDCASYVITGAPGPVTDLGELTVFSTFIPRDESLWGAQECKSELVTTNLVNETLEDVIVFEGLCPNEFDVSAFVTRNFEIMMGHLYSNFTLTETGRDVYVYLPVVTEIGTEPINGSIAEDESEQLTTVLKNCNIQPVSTSPQSPNCI